MNRLTLLILSTTLACSLASMKVSLAQTPDAAKAKAKAKAKATGKGKAAAGQRPLQRIFIELDKNENQTLERSEVPKAALKEFDALLELIDTNKDQAIDRTELQASGEKIQKILGAAAIPAPATATPSPNQPGNFAGDPAERFSRMDLNKDGFISKDEWRGQEENFGRMDRDGDGKLSKDEQEAAIATMRRFMQATKKKAMN